MAGLRDKAEKAGGMRDCKTLFWTLENQSNDAKGRMLAEMKLLFFWKACETI